MLQKSLKPAQPIIKKYYIENNYRTILKILLSRTHNAQRVVHELNEKKNNFF